MENGETATLGVGSTASSRNRAPSPNHTPLEERGRPKQSLERMDLGVVCRFDMVLVSGEL